MSKKQNEKTWQHFKAALEGSRGMATSRGFSHVGQTDGHLLAAEAGVDPLFNKYWVLPDGKHTEPIVHDMSRCNFCVWRDDQQFLAYEATLGPTMQIIQKRPI